MTNEEAIKVLKLVSCENKMVNSILQNAIKIAISALESQKWIPTVERLPEDDETVIVYKPIAKGTPIEMQIIQGWGINTAIMSHWMPLPQPPREEIE